MQFNYHTHTARCNHAVGTDKEYVEKAIEKGLKTLGFSDHAPYLFPDGLDAGAHRMKVEQIQEYAESIRALKKEYAKDIRILCGFELEYYPEYHKEEMLFLNSVSPDYILLGQHFIGAEHEGRLSSKNNSDENLAHYVTQVLSALSTGDFLYLAHPDMPGNGCSIACKQTQYRRLCEGARRMNIPLEINLLGIRNHRNYPTETFFKIAGEVGNDVVLGIDAHSPDSILDDKAEEVANAMVKAYNLKRIEKEWL